MKFESFLTFSSRLSKVLGDSFMLCCISMPTGKSHFERSVSFWDSPTESVTCLFWSSIATSSPACTKNVLDRATWGERFVIAGEKPRNGSVTSR